MMGASIKVMKASRCERRETHAWHQPDALVHRHVRSATVRTNTSRERRSISMRSIGRTAGRSHRVMGIGVLLEANRTPLLALHSSD